MLNSLPQDGDKRVLPRNTLPGVRSVLLASSSLSPSRVLPAQPPSVCGEQVATGSKTEGHRSLDLLRPIGIPVYVSPSPRDEFPQHRPAICPGLRMALVQGTKLGHGLEPGLQSQPRPVVPEEFNGNVLGVELSPKPGRFPEKMLGPDPPTLFPSKSRRALGDDFRVLGLRPWKVS